MSLFVRSAAKASLNDDDLLTNVGEFLSMPDALDRAVYLDRQIPRSQSNAAIRQWRSWLSAHREHLTRLQLRQKLETQMFDTAEYPHVSLRKAGEVKSILVETAAEVDAWCAGDPANIVRAQAAKTELSVLARSWNEVDRAIGYSLAVDEEAKAFERLQRAAKRLVMTSAGSHLDIIAKLHVLLAEMQPSSGCTDHPWPELRLMLADLVHLAKAGGIDAGEEQAP